MLNFIVFLHDLELGPEKNSLYAVNNTFCLILQDVTIDFLLKHWKLIQKWKHSHGLGWLTSIIIDQHELVIKSRKKGKWDAQKLLLAYVSGVTRL